jgi:hypothetical protein
MQIKRKEMRHQEGKREENRRRKENCSCSSSTYK